MTAALREDPREDPRETAGWSRTCAPPGWPRSTAPPAVGPSTPPTPPTTGCSPRWSPSRGTATRCSRRSTWRRRTGTPLTVRGAGTSIAGNSIGPGIVLDTSRYLNRVLEVDPAARTARVEPGAVMATLQLAAAPHGLRFGPDPSTWTRATLGGMIGNNACGPHAVAYGKTAQNVRSLDWVDGTGRRWTAGSGDASFAAVPGLADLVGSELALLRTELGRFGRQVSGYSLEHLLPENGSHLARALVGTEGTCGLLLEAELDLVPVPSAPTLVVLGYADMPAAADAVPALLAHRPARDRGHGRPAGRARAPAPRPGERPGAPGRCRVADGRGRRA